jgi:chaperonin GroEL
MEHLGRCRLATIDKEETTIIDGRGDETAIKERAMSIKKQIEDSQSAFEKENLQSRLANLSGGVAIINIGAFTEAELEEMKDRVDDALHATRAAVKGGVIPGGGAALIKAKKSLSKLKSDNDYQKIGIKIVEKALDSPLRQILTNSGIENYYEIISKIQNNKQWGFGYDAKIDKFTDLLKSGVIDPTYVTINALQNAASIAGTLLTTEAVIYNKEDKSPKNSMSDLMGMGDMG